MSIKGYGLKPFCDIFDIDIGLPYVIGIRRVVGEYQQISIIITDSAFDLAKLTD